MDRWQGLQLAILLSAIPVQYLISNYTSGTLSQRTFALNKLFDQASNWRNTYMSWYSWHKWCSDILRKSYGIKFSDVQDEPLGESPAVEVLKYRDPEGYFAGSPEPRSPRPPEVKFKIGQVVKHRIWGYRGVIVGWDATARAPDNWLKQMHPKDKPHWAKQPNYAILVDTRDRLEAQTTYVPQENLQIISKPNDKTSIVNPAIDHFFEKFEGSRFLPRPWLRSIYPDD